MVKCTQCGAEYPDGPKFCKTCGNRLVNSSEEKCPVCGKPLMPDSEFCGFCGAKIIREKHKVCPSCGAEYPPQLKFCIKDGTELCDVEPNIKPVTVSSDGAVEPTPVDGSTDVTVEPTTDSADGSAGGAVESTTDSVDISAGGAVEPTTDSADGPAGGAVESATDSADGSAGGASVQNSTRKSSKAAVAVNRFMTKAVVFENKYLVIRNGVIALLSLLFVFFALLMPINVMGYGDGELIYTDGFEDLNEISDIKNNMTDGDEFSLACHPVKVKQSIWKMFAALKYINLDHKVKSDRDLIDGITKEYDKAVKEARDEAFDEVAVKGAGSGEPTIPESKLDDFYKEYEKSLSKHLSKMNYLAYLLAKDVAPGPYAVDVTSLVFGVVVAVLSILIAALAVAALVFAVIGMVKRKQMLGFMRFLKIATIVSGVVVLISALNPLGRAGGAMFTIFMISAIAWLLGGVTQTIINGNVKVSTLIWRSAIALVFIIGIALLLCTNSVCLRTSADITKNSGKKIESASVLYKVYAPVGALFAEALQDAVGIMEGIETKTDLTGVIISGIVSYVIAMIALSVLMASVVSALKTLASNDRNKKLPLVLPIISTVFVLAFIIVTGAVSGTIFNAFATLITSQYIEFNSKAEVSFMFYARTQVYFTLAFALASAVCSLVLRLKKRLPPAERIVGNADASVGKPSGDAQG